LPHSCNASFTCEIAAGPSWVCAEAKAKLPKREENTIASQTASLIEFAKSLHVEVPAESVLEDEYSGATLEVRACSGCEITRRLNAEGIPTRKTRARRERSIVWALLRNPTYRGIACFAKTRISARSRKKTRA
jgi:hypothetical protein